MQRWQPMQRPWSTSTMPSGPMWAAPVGQTLAHGASSQCMHCSGTCSTLTLGYSPTSRSSKRMNESVGSKPFWRWHAVRQA